MKYKFLLLFLTVFFQNTLSAQEMNYVVASIPDSIKSNANAVHRLNQVAINIVSQRKINVSRKRVVTVFNESGMNAIDAFAHYDKSTTISDIQAIVLDAFGNEIKKFKRKDFKDHSAVDGGTLFSDSRVLYLDYTPINYPFTIIFTCETSSISTAFIPQWFPIPEYSVGVEKSVLHVSFPENLGFKKKENNFAHRSIVKTNESPTEVSYMASNLVPVKYEDLSPEFEAIMPNVMMGLTAFHLEGIDGNASTWEDFGKWWAEKILAGTDQISEATQLKIRAVVGDETDPIIKAKKVYSFVQEKVRYISIQEGIGGWKPMLASDVDRLGYGDCKALTNYTQALLKSVGVTSYYTKVFGDKSKRNITKDFVSQQGNHIILALPVGDHYTWLECTSQTDPFGFQANFTDDRDVLIVKPEGGEIVHTKIYTPIENAQRSIGNYSIASNGDFQGEIQIVSTGTQYGNKELIQRWQPDEKDKHYKEYWDNINNLKLDKISFENNKNEIRFIENAKLSATNYGAFVGQKMMITLNAFNKYEGGLKRIRNRKMPFEIARGFVDEDEITIHLPQGFVVEFMPPSFESKTKFGTYRYSCEKKDATSLIYKRVFTVNSGNYSNKEYEEYRLFLEQVSQNDNAKIVVTQT
jgi:hypothetical protein